MQSLGHLARRGVDELKQLLKWPPSARLYLVAAALVAAVATMSGMVARHYAAQEGARRASVANAAMSLTLCPAVLEVHGRDPAYDPLCGSMRIHVLEDRCQWLAFVRTQLEAHDALMDQFSVIPAETRANSSALAKQLRLDVIYVSIRDCGPL